LSIETKVNRFNDLIQSSFRNAMDTVESIHQTSAEMPLEVLRELGYPEEKTETIKEAHRKILRIMYGGICNAHQELGKLVVMQTGELSRFATDIMPSRDWQSKTKAPDTSPARKKVPAKKVAASKPTATASEVNDG